MKLRYGRRPRAPRHSPTKSAQARAAGNYCSRPSEPADSPRPGRRGPVAMPTTAWEASHLLWHSGAKPAVRQRWMEPGR